MDRYRLQTIAGILNENEYMVLEKLNEGIKIFNVYYIKKNENKIVIDIMGMNEWISLITKKNIQPLEINLNDKSDYFFNNFEKIPKIKKIYDTYNFRYFNGSFENTYVLFKSYFDEYKNLLNEFMYQFYCIDEKRAIETLKMDIDIFSRVYRGHYYDRYDDNYKNYRYDYGNDGDDEDQYDFWNINTNFKMIKERIKKERFNFKIFMQQRFTPNILLNEYIEVLKKMSFRSQHITIIGLNNKLII